MVAFIYINIQLWPLWNSANPSSLPYLEFQLLQMVNPQADVTTSTAARKWNTFPILMQRILPAKHGEWMGRNLIPSVSQMSEWKVFCHDFESLWMELMAASKENGRGIVPERKITQHNHATTAQQQTLSSEQGPI